MAAMVAQRGNGPTARPVRLICIVAAGNYHFYSKRHNQRNHGLFPGYASMLHMEAGEAKMNPTSEIFLATFAYWVKCIYGPIVRIHLIV